MVECERASAAKGGEKGGGGVYMSKFLLREEECMHQEEVVEASSGSGTLRVSSRAVEARLDVPVENFYREGKDTYTTMYLLSYCFIYINHMYVFIFV